MIKIWDLNKKYAYKHYGFQDQWTDKVNWSEVPYDVTSYNFIGDCALEGENFWISLHSNLEDAVFLYAKTDSIGTPSRHNEIYRAHDTPNGCRNYSGGSILNTIIKNTQEEIIVESKGGLNSNCNTNTYVTTQYRLLNNKNYFQVLPISQADEQGFHGESRLNIIPDLNGNQDYVADSLKLALNGISDQHNFPPNCKMLIDPIVDADVIWLMIWENPNDASPFTISQKGGAKSGWENITNELYQPDRVWSSPFNYFKGNPITIGIINDIPQFRHSFWNYQPIYQYVNKGTVLRDWFVNYKLSPRNGQPWFPGYPGIWKVIGCIDGNYDTQEINVTDTTKSLEYVVQTNGYFEYAFAYLYDRNQYTPIDIQLPTDIYKEITPFINNDTSSTSVASAIGFIGLAIIAVLATKNKRRYNK